MKRRDLVASLACSAFLGPGVAFGKPHKWRTDPKTGRQYWDEYVFVPGSSVGSLKGGKIRHWKTKAVYISFETDVNIAAKPQPSGPEIQSESDATAARAAAKTDNPEMVVDTVGYAFGAAGVNAAGTALAYGVASSIAGLGDQAGRIAALQQDIRALQDGLAAQIAEHGDILDRAAAIVAARGTTILNSTSEPSILPVSAFDDILRTTDQTYLFATPDPYLATRLHRIVLALEQSDPATTPNAVADLTRAMVRQADATSAVGNDAEAEAIYAMARNVADLAVGLDPVSGVVRGAYELATGQNMITGAALSQGERAFAAVNLVLLGGFGTIGRGMTATAKIGHILGGARGTAIGKAVVEIIQHWPTKTIEKLMAGYAARMLSSSTEHVALSANKALVPVGPVNGVYARVMSASYAEKLFDGGRLAVDEFAFITDSKAIEGLTKWDEVRRRLSLMDTVNIGEFRKFADDVVVEFKFKLNEPLVYLQSPFGEAGRYGPAFLPGGYTSGGAPEWVVDALAVEKNMIDIGSITIRPLFP
ncbi:pre-toxin TG domain-containing protein [Sphingomonas colocasiae]|uniref:Pre-toxin TG domain-containing protein n=1 Tax=Sphingomonas colocasiae TaxID=1848973 RepID=A0ABS7PZW3_9SPHN|nr:pre-toxin TG domain-containing protein [Sphingomonas colocasiae]MBY8825539.1 pre-toxin TG domain-containing protein [Sphingomonas colocasiae]